MNEPKPTPELLGPDGVEEILAADDRLTVDVYVPEWKKTIRLRQLTAAESVQLTQIPKNEGLTTIVAMSAIDAAGNKLFKDVDRLKGKSAAALARLQEEALRLNGFSANAVVAAKNA
jgi:hypothetical protein